MVFFLIIFLSVGIVKHELIPTWLVIIRTVQFKHVCWVLFCVLAIIRMLKFILAGLFWPVRYLKCGSSDMLVGMFAGSCSISSCAEFHLKFQSIWFYATLFILAMQCWLKLMSCHDFKNMRRYPRYMVRFLNKRLFIKYWVPAAMLWM